VVVEALPLHLSAFHQILYRDLAQGAFVHQLLQGPGDFLLRVAAHDGVSSYFYFRSLPRRGPGVRRDRAPTRAKKRAQDQNQRFPTVQTLNAHLKGSPIELGLLVKITERP
jgi:hypothetical protein